MEGKPAAIYCRVDSGGAPKIQRNILDVQRSKLEHCAANMGLEIVGYYEDKGSSGHNMARSGLTKLLDDAESGAFEMVLVVNRTRLFRGSRWDEPKWPFQVYSINPLEHSVER